MVNPDFKDHKQGRWNVLQKNLLYFCIGNIWKPGFGFSVENYLLDIFILISFAPWREIGLWDFSEWVGHAAEMVWAPEAFILLSSWRGEWWHLGFGEPPEEQLCGPTGGCPRIVGTLQSAVTPNVELFSGIFSQVSGQWKHYFINKLRKGVWIATVERLHKECAPVYSPFWRI